ncbi:conserved hypothetical protein [Cellulomonas flavigena DSM 20109]|uniref:DUF559 domain-containing protein n=1 Tax=Cellulomonas flavigena (strain ATCC 482 / DSM 20109 / BCRC 11376 / JCM 18109 / NBRC 3775 / NCIMB 8073 / NRS 134) TaxID=446466 RepID=D5ULG1_CELFN|nr:hypothetical protein [Cellulomonas flavigena]ADG74003.1 conserved hypothetical protein [Cellulomonas flavigena DSM 20109]
MPVVRGVLDLASEVERWWGAPLFGDAAAGREELRDPDHLRRRSAWTALLALGPERAVAVGACALALYGVEGLPRDIRPEASLEAGDAGGATVVAEDGGPAGPRRPRGVARARQFRTAEIHVVRGARMVAPELALAQAVCELSREHAVAVLDSAVQQRLVTPDLLAVRALARGRRGAARLADWWELVDGRAQSPLETRARLQCVDACIPPDDLQVPVRDVRGRIVARGDLGWHLAGDRLLVVEIDGRGPHSTPAALYRDRERQNAIVASGTVVLRFTAADVGSARVVPVIRPLLAGRTRPSAAHRAL